MRIELKNQQPCYSYVQSAHSPLFVPTARGLKKKKAAEQKNVAFKFKFFLSDWSRAESHTMESMENYWKTENHCNRPVICTFSLSLSVRCSFFVLLVSFIAVSFMFSVFSCRFSLLSTFWNENFSAETEALDRTQTTVQNEFTKKKRIDA